MRTVGKILVTGAAGKVGSALRPLLAAEYGELVLTDVVEVGGLAENERFVRGDVADKGFVRKVMTGVDGVVHLAGMVGAGFSFDEVLGPNIVGTHHVFEAAVECGVANVVYASSHHAVGFIRRGERIDHETAHRPDSEYGLSKAFGESAAAFFADKFGLNVLSVRIGYVGTEVENERRLHTWVSARDLAQLVGIGLRTEGLGHEIVYGVSEVPEPFFDNGNAERLGYRPVDRAVDFVTGLEVFEEVPDLGTVEEGVVGGGFAGVGFCGDVSRVLGGRSGGQGCLPSGEGRVDRDVHTPGGEFFDPGLAIEVHGDRLPHWRQEGVWVFVTWRLGDSLPESRLSEWREERDAWVAMHPKPWDERSEVEYRERFTDQLDEWLDEGCGECLLREPETSRIVVDALRHFDGERYELGAFVVMPNHVHVLFRPLGRRRLADIVQAWKGFTATKINHRIGGEGSIWQRDYWDRLIRGEEHFGRVVEYIRGNPRKGKLREGEFVLMIRGEVG